MPSVAHVVGETDTISHVGKYSPLGAAASSVARGQQQRSGELKQGNSRSPTLDQSPMPVFVRVSARWDPALADDPDKRSCLR